jgi:CheY-like chemotaxis protein
LQILLVEDNPFDAELIEATLQAQFGCQITTVGSKVDFEAALERAQPDFIISDSNLPSFEGLVALQLAIQKYPQVPFIFCSGLCSDQKKAEALAHGAIECLPKDDLTNLIALVKSLCGDADSSVGPKG